MLSNWFKRAPFTATLCLTVIASHLGVLLLLTVSHYTPVKPNPKKLIVKHIAPKMAATPPKPVPKTPAAPKVKTAPAPIQAAPAPQPAAVNNQKSPAPPPPQKPKAKKKNVVAAPVKKETSTKKPPVPAKKSVPQQLLQELEESISKIDRKSDNLSSNGGKKRDFPISIAPLHIDNVDDVKISDEIFQDTEYQKTIIDYLRQALNLPEYGEVKIQVTLSEEGAVLGLKVLKTESDINKKYLEKNLSRLKFPPLDKKRTFVLTFCNE